MGTMSAPSPAPVFQLPPLILHPFAQPYDPVRLIEGSRAGIILRGLLPQGELDNDELERRLLDGRYCEISMLFYVGKDVLRWARQCQEAVQRAGVAPEEGYCAESFIALLVENTPQKVDQKLRSWGVQEYRRIFARAVGLHAVFRDLPPPELLAGEFVLQYHRFADHLYACRQQLQPFRPAKPEQFDFEVYASGEYARLLEQEWDGL